MTSLTEFFNKHEDDALKGITHKNSIIKRNIIAHMAVNGECTLSELTKELHISVPTITKLVQELVDENIVTDLGKVETPGGRRPNIFGLANSAIYFAGVNVGRDNMRFLITDLQNNIIKEENDFTFELLDRPQCIERICSGIENFIATCGIDRGKILGLGVCMTGRVNPDTGRSYKYFTSSEQSLRDLLEERVGIRVLLENDTRARCYAEYTCGKSKDESNVLYLHRAAAWPSASWSTDSSTTARAASPASSATFPSSTTRSSARAARRAASKPRFRASPSRTRCAT